MRYFTLYELYVLLIITLLVVLVLVLGSIFVLVIAATPHFLSLCSITGPYYDSRITK